MIRVLQEISFTLDQQNPLSAIKYKSRDEYHAINDIKEEKETYRLGHCYQLYEIQNCFGCRIHLVKPFSL